MKVIGFTGNYGIGESDLQCYLMADSSILYSGRPFFLPDFAQSFVAMPTIIVRMGRLGKCIAPKFAHRYWDAFTAGFTIHALQSDNENLTALDRAFDGAAIVGEWVSVSDVDNAYDTVVEVMLDGNILSQCRLADMKSSLDDLLAAVSTRCSIKMGDMIFTGDTADGTVLKPGNRLTASIGGRQVLEVKVRL
jgi:2-keto-4-pentenoate hydratase/2-oxohepta-3-ene-1,7-dioic acid hydratase in catechol pathway